MEVDAGAQQQAFDIETEPLSPSKLSPSPKYVLKLIRLNPGISSLNFTCCMINATILVFAFMITGMLQPLILVDRDYYDVGQNHIGTITSLALFVELIVKMIVLIPYGHCSDKFGRKIVLYYGSASYLIACLLLYSQNEIFPGFILAKILLANGSAALFAAPFLADYTADETKGRASGLMVLCVGLSTVFANLFVKLLLYEKISLGWCYAITGIVVASVITLNSFGLKRGDYQAPTDTPISVSLPAPANTDVGATEVSHIDENNNANIDGSTASSGRSLEEEPPRRISVFRNLKQAAREFKASGWLQVALILHVAASASSFVFFTYMSLYVKSLFPEEVDDNTTNIAVNNIQTFMFVPAFFCSLTYGYFMSKQERALKMSTIAASGIIVAFILMAVSTAPTDVTLIFAALLMGSSMPGLFVISGYLSIKNYPSDQRGVMVGFMSIISNTLYFLIVSSGGLMYDNWTKRGPFILGIGLLLLGLLLVLIIYKVKGLNKSG